ncbi:MAG TPA: LuxR C-terminal-related transcriptional regulator [Opitutaceae bacterium]|nr:LuxR C-terminal-related transcriptional regulator [Opitutaceae bacterium]
MDKSSSAVDQLRTALAALAEGKNYFSPAFIAAQQGLRANSNSFDKVLSACKQEILPLVGEGLSDDEIALRIGISATTSQTHRRNILQKPNIKGTPKLTAFAISHAFARVPSRTPFLKTN